MIVGGGLLSTAAMLEVTGTHKLLSADTFLAVLH